MNGVRYRLDRQASSQEKQTLAEAVLLQDLVTQLLKRASTHTGHLEAGQVELVVDEVIERVLESTGEQLPLQVNGEETRAGVDVFVAGHAVCSITKSMMRC